MRMKEKNRVVSVFTLIAVLFAMLFMDCSVVNAETSSETHVQKEKDFSEYTPISTKEELNNVRNDLDGKYYLTCDIVFTEEDFKEGGDYYNNGKGWSPIGSSKGGAFLGTFDGNGHTIKGIIINARYNTSMPKIDSTYAGLFGVNAGIIENLGVINGKIFARTTGDQYGYAFPKSYVGGITGFNSQGTIRNCYSNQSIEVNNADSVMTYCGGITGYNEGSGSGEWIECCYNIGNIEVIGGKSQFVGGICGVEESASTNECFNQGELKVQHGEKTTVTKIGGIAGNFQSWTAIENCYNSADISIMNEFEHESSIYAGGILGDMQGGFRGGLIRCCYNVGNIGLPDTCLNAKVGGIAGTATHFSDSSSLSSIGENLSLEGCYYLNNLEYGVGSLFHYMYDAEDGRSYSDKNNVVKKSSIELSKKENLQKFDFEKIWSYNTTGNYQYPILKVFERKCEHIYSDWVITKASTCSHRGEKERVCTLCQNKEIMEIPIDSTAHTYGEWIITQNATCTTPGQRERICSSCKGEDTKQTEVIPIDLTAHNYGEWITTKAPTCSAAGEKERVCTLCQNKETEEIAIDPTAHSFTNYVYNNDAKVGVDGTETAVCDYGCGVTNTRIKEGSALDDGGGSWVPPMQYPNISEGDGYITSLSNRGRKVTITVDEDYELVDVSLNGESKGIVTELSGLRTGDEVIITVISKVEKIQQELKGVNWKNFLARSAQVKMKNGKKAIKITLINHTGIDFDGIEVFRSLKKNSGYGTEPIFTTTNDKYYNTAVKKGTRYYYKARGYIEYKGVRYYSGWSAKAWRMVK